MKKNVEAGAELGQAIEGRDSTAIDRVSGLLAERIRVVLCRPRHPGNIGAAARALKTMGLKRLYLVDPERFSNPPETDEAMARASGAGDVLESAVICENLTQALAGVHFAAALTARVREVSPVRKEARDATGDLWGRVWAGEEVALVFGSETAGLSNEELMCCDLSVGLPSNPAYSSLNLAAAVQILCYELRMTALQAGLGDAGFDGPDSTQQGGHAVTLSPIAPRDDVERFFVHLESVMGETGFFDAGNPKKLMPKIRRLFARTALERDEINILRGFLASVTQFRRK